MHLLGSQGVSFSGFVNFDKVEAVQQTLTESPPNHPNKELRMGFRVPFDLTLET